jgi:hypothetical protein
MTIGRRMDEAWKRAISEGKKKGKQFSDAKESTGLKLMHSGRKRIDGGAAKQGLKKGLLISLVSPRLGAEIGLLTGKREGRTLAEKAKIKAGKVLTNNKYK